MKDSTYLLLLGAAIIIGLTLKDFRKDTWIGVYYPDAGNLLVDVRSGPLESLDECRTWILWKNEDYQSDRYDYECGKNCEVDVEADLMICEETVK